MFYQLLYTRCRYGWNSLKATIANSSDGFKISRFSRKLLDDERIDIPFLEDIAKTKQRYQDPDYMDDAYLYYVTDKPESPSSRISYLNEFHPIHFDPSLEGDYSHRPGNFLNHFLIGDFANLFPYEFFGDDQIWCAKSQNEAYYYKVKTEDVPVLQVAEPHGRYSFADIGRFINEGRRSVLQQAVSFLLEQYSLPQNKRKYLVVYDRSSEEIEKWVAAIECAFSPRISTGIPFATRMDNFQQENRYAVDQSGKMRSIDYQNPNLTIKFRAMVVGTPSWTKTNLSDCRNDFVLLNGIDRQIDYNSAENVDSGFLHLITCFNEKHEEFIKEFLQMFDLTEPSKELFKICDLYEDYVCKLQGDSVNQTDLLHFLEEYSSYKICALSSCHNRIYDIALDTFQGLFQKNPLESLGIVNWIAKTSENADSSDQNRQSMQSNIEKAVCNQVVNGIITENPKFDEHFLKAFLNTPIADSFARRLSSSAFLNYISSNFSGWPAGVKMNLVDVFCKLYRLPGFHKERLADFLAVMIESFPGYQQSGVLVKAWISLQDCPEIEWPFWLGMASSHPDIANSIIDVIVRFDKELEENRPEKVSQFCSMLYRYGLDEHIVIVFKYYVPKKKLLEGLSRTRLFNRASRLVKSESWCFTSSVPSCIKLRDSDAVRIKRMLQDHIDMLSDLKKDATIKSGFMQRQYPIILNKIYVDEFISLLISADVPKFVEHYILELFCERNDSYLPAYTITLCSGKNEKNSLKLKNLLNVMLGIDPVEKREILFMSFFQSLNSLKNPRIIERIRDSINDPKSKMIFEKYAQKYMV